MDLASCVSLAVVESTISHPYESRKHPALCLYFAARQEMPPHVSDAIFPKTSHAKFTSTGAVRWQGGNRVRP